MSLKKIIEMLKRDGSKGFVMDESGEVQFVVVPVSEYDYLTSDKTSLVSEVDADVERVNRAIMEAKLEEERKSGLMQVNSTMPGKHVSTDLRAEVIDPSFDFDAGQEEV